MSDPQAKYTSQKGNLKDFLRSSLFAILFISFFLYSPSSLLPLEIVYKEGFGAGD